MGLVKKNFNSKISEVENKIPNVNGFLLTSVFNSKTTEVENKIPAVSSLVKKTDYNTNISDIEKKIIDHNHDQYITTPEFNTMAADDFNARLAAQTDVIRKPEFDFKLKGIRERVIKNKTKHLLQKFNAAYFRGKSHFEEDGTQNYLVFQPMYRYFRKIISVGSGNYIYFWKSIGLSDDRLNSNNASIYKITPELSYYGTKTRLELGSCLKQDKVTYNHGKIANIYIVYEICKNCSISSYPTLENCLFGAVSLTKNADIDKYNYSGYGTGFGRKGHLVETV